MIKKLFLSLILVFSFSLFPVLTQADNLQSVVIEENDFQQLSKKMEAESLGLVLMFHAEHCPYCAQMDLQILSPMVKSGNYEGKVLIRKLQIDEARDIINFEGKTVEPSEIAKKYDTYLTPTLVFLDSKGNERAKKMVGINTVEYFGAYLDQEIETLRKSLGKGDAN